jgi:hypothetical protein
MTELYTEYVLLSNSGLDDYCRYLERWKDRLEGRGWSGNIPIHGLTRLPKLLYWP